MANVSHAIGTMTLKGPWTDSMISNINILRGEWMSGYYDINIFESFSPDEKSQSFSASGKWHFCNNLEHLSDWSINSEIPGVAKAFCDLTTEMGKTPDAFIHIKCADCEPAMDIFEKLELKLIATPCDISSSSSTKLRIATYAEMRPDFSPISPETHEETYAIVCENKEQTYSSPYSFDYKVIKRIAYEYTADNLLRLGIHSDINDIFEEQFDMFSGKYADADDFKELKEFFGKHFKAFLRYLINDDEIDELVKSGFFKDRETAKKLLKKPKSKRPQ